MTAPTTPDSILAGHAPAVRALGNTLRALVRDTIPDSYERAYPGWHAIGFRHPHAGYFCGVFPMRDHVRFLFEHGIALHDPDGVLTGNGKQVRYVDIHKPEQINANALRELMLQAVALKSRRD